MSLAVSKPFSEDLIEARRVLKNEAEALTALSTHLDDSFVQAVQLIAQTQGKVVVTGMGKSGLIGQKIAATFASTGTSSFFVHPGEASHGDLGMVTESDTLIALSNSGETSELSDILHFSGRRGVPVIAITSKKESTLAELAKVTIALPKKEEACPLGLAPTTSTTMMVALGDALATAVLKRRGFSSADFGSLHPGGKLGQRLHKISKVMHTENELPLVSLQDMMSKALLEMTSKKFGCVGVVNDAQELVGMITDGDLRRHMENALIERTTEQVMTANPMVIKSTAMVEEAVAIMESKKITCLFVTESEKSKKPIGILHIHDCLQAGVR